MKSSKKKSKKKTKAAAPTTTTAEAAAAYFEDLGSAGIKSSSTANGPIPKLNVTKTEKKRRAKRLERFGTATSASSSTTSSSGSEEDDKDNSKSINESLLFGNDSNNHKNNNRNKKRKTSTTTTTITGTSQSLTRSYTRNTPNIDDIRPLPVLMKSFQHVKAKYIQTEDYEWTNEQFKCIRQDITIQQYKNEFALDVYETHARIVLEHGDLSEFNQCQTMILSLTSEKIKQTAKDEFSGYRILYSIVQKSGWDLHSAMKDHLIGSSCTGPATNHAFQVVKAICHDDFQSFFKLYESAPHLSAYLMDFLVRRVRLSALERIIAAYRPSVSIEYVREALFLSDLEETRRCLRQFGAVFVSDPGGLPFWVDCRATSLVTGTGVHRSKDDDDRKGK
mmetsp:Transcript_23711/g.66958  ORF Transcript_23711/g.66958 Transcript_23711/m.66958 type:complete len:392 (-) Transcript_23711:181-1356(-)